MTNRRKATILQRLCVFILAGPAAARMGKAMQKQLTKQRTGAAVPTLQQACGEVASEILSL